MGQLTALKVKHAKAGRHGDGDGLHLLVSKTGAKSWVLRLQVNGRRRDIGLGPLADYTLEEARDRAREIRKAARAGADPIAARNHREFTPPTFKEAAFACHEAKAPGWSERHAAAFLSTLTLHIYPKIGSLRVDSITDRDVAAALSPIWLAKPSAGRKLRQRIGLVLDYAKANGWRDTAAPRHSLSTLLAKQQEAGNFASMPYAELPAFIDTVEAGEVTVGRLALLFTILTAARNGEVREAMWSQIDFEAGEWKRPASMMRKTGKAHTITLSGEAIAILRRAEAFRTNKKDCVIFGGKGGKSLSDMTLSKIVKPTGYTVHGFRSTFRTWAAEKMPSVPEAVAEAALAHVIPDKVVRAYNRAKFMEMRRTLLDAWGRYAFRTSADVVQLPLRLQG